MPHKQRKKRFKINIIYPIIRFVNASMRMKSQSRSKQRKSMWMSGYLDKENLREQRDKKHFLRRQYERNKVHLKTRSNLKYYLVKDRFLDWICLREKVVLRKYKGWQVFKLRLFSTIGSLSFACMIFSYLVVLRVSCRRIFLLVPQSRQPPFEP